MSWRGNLLAVAIGIGMGLLMPTAAAEKRYDYRLKRDDWPAHANGQNVLAVAAVKKTLQRFDETDSARIVIHYPGGDFGRQWANEVHNRLVSFGVPVAYLEKQVGSGAGDRLVLEIIDGR